jgi:hypothetical protein
MLLWGDILCYCEATFMLLWGDIYVTVRRHKMQLIFIYQYLNAILFLCYCEATFSKFLKLKNNKIPITYAIFFQKFLPYIDIY